MRIRMVVLLALLLLLAACAGVAPLGKLAGDCSGVPGDGRTPPSPSTDELLANAHAVGPTRYVARARPATANAIPPLYVFDDVSSPVFVEQLRALGFDDAVFEHAESEAYWGEVVDGGYARVPWLDKCSAASMLDRPIDFRAPAGGVLFLQFVAEGCEECEAVTQAISRHAAARHVPLRWVQVEVPRSVGRPGR